MEEASSGFGLTQLLLKMKLLQNQVYKHGDEYLRIVRLERLAVEYKTLRDLLTKDGTHHVVSKKEFCRLIKTATLLNGSELPSN